MSELNGSINTNWWEESHAKAGPYEPHHDGYVKIKGEIPNETIVAIRSAYKPKTEGTTMSDLMKRFNLTRAVIRNIIDFASYADAELELGLINIEYEYLE